MRWRRGLRPARAWSRPCGRWSATRRRGPAATPTLRPTKAPRLRIGRGGELHGPSPPGRPRPDAAGADAGRRARHLAALTPRAATPAAAARSKRPAGPGVSASRARADDDPAHDAPGHGAERT